MRVGPLLQCPLTLALAPPFIEPHSEWTTQRAIGPSSDDCCYFSLIVLAFFARTLLATRNRSGVLNSDRIRPVVWIQKEPPKIACNLSFLSLFVFVSKTVAQHYPLQKARAFKKATSEQKAIPGISKTCAK